MPAAADRRARAVGARRSGRPPCPTPGTRSLDVRRRVRLPGSRVGPVRQLLRARRRPRRRAVRRAAAADDGDARRRARDRDAVPARGARAGRPRRLALRRGRRRAARRSRRRGRRVARRLGRDPRVGARRPARAAPLPGRPGAARLLRGLPRVGHPAAPAATSTARSRSSTGCSAPSCRRVDAAGGSMCAHRDALAAVAAATTTSTGAGSRSPGRRSTTR